VVVNFFSRLRAQVGLAALVLAGAGNAHAAGPDARDILTPPVLVEAMRC
jgi:hypothetical protein